MYFLQMRTGKTKLNTKKKSWQKQGPKLTFFGRRQLATEIFFSVAKWKNVVAKKCR